MHQLHDPRWRCYDPRCWSCAGHLYEPSFYEIDGEEEEEDEEDEADSCAVCCRYAPRVPRRRSLGLGSGG